jgi:hypothetical protein
MRLRYQTRATVALIAAYAVALQTLLLTFGGVVPGAAQAAAVPLCSASRAAGPPGPASPAPGHDCLAACLTGCCCGGATVPGPGIAIAYLPEPAQTVAVAIETTAALPSGIAPAHRSRAPPLD